MSLFLPPPPAAIPNFDAASFQDDVYIIASRHKMLCDRYDIFPYRNYVYLINIQQGFEQDNSFNIHNLCVNVHEIMF